jgi:hypothetical protein
MASVLRVVPVGLLMLFSGVNNINRTETNQNNTQDRCQTLPNESNPTTNTTETTDQQQRKQHTVSVKNASNSLMMDIQLSETCWSLNDGPHLFLTSVLKKCVLRVFKA